MSREFLFLILEETGSRSLRMGGETKRHVGCPLKVCWECGKGICGYFRPERTVMFENRVSGPMVTITAIKICKKLWNVFFKFFFSLN